MPGNPTTSHDTSKSRLEERNRAFLQTGFSEGLVGMPRLPVGPRLPCADDDSLEEAVEGHQDLATNSSRADARSVHSMAHDRVPFRGSEPSRRVTRVTTVTSPREWWKRSSATPSPTS